MQVRERQRLDERQHPLDVLVGLAGKTDDDVRADGGVRHTVVDAGHEALVEPARVRAPHHAQHLVGAVLQRQVEVRRHTR